MQWKDASDAVLGGRGKPDHVELVYPSSSALVSQQCRSEESHEHLITVCGMEI